MQEELEKLGLTRNESRVYLSLLDLGLTSTKSILEKTQLHRQIIYDSLAALSEKGLVSHIIKNNRKYFRCTNPKQFLKFFDSQEKKLQEERNKFKQILPQLVAKHEYSEEEQEATIYTGKKGIKIILDDILREGKPLYTIGASDSKAEAFSYHLKFNLPIFHKTREKKRIKFEVLLSSDLKERAKMFNKMKYSRAKLLPKNFTSNTSINIYGDKLSIILWGKNPFAVLIHSKEIADGQMKHFKTLWGMAKHP